MSHQMIFESLNRDGSVELNEMSYAATGADAAIRLVDELLRTRHLVCGIEPAEAAVYLVNELQARVLRILADHGGEEHVTGMVEAFDAGCAKMTRGHRVAQYMALPLWLRDAMFLTDTYCNLREQVMQRRAAVAP